jgi:hypothetical protein
VITFDPILDADALRAAPAEEALALGNSFRVHFDPSNDQATREAGGRFFYRVLLKYLSTATPPN